MCDLGEAEYMQCQLAVWWYPFHSGGPDRTVTHLLFIQLEIVRATTSRLYQTSKLVCYKKKEKWWWWMPMAVETIGMLKDKRKAIERWMELSYWLVWDNDAVNLLVCDSIAGSTQLAASGWADTDCLSSCYCCRRFRRSLLTALRDGMRVDLRKWKVEIYDKHNVSSSRLNWKGQCHAISRIKRALKHSLFATGPPGFPGYCTVRIFSKQGFCLSYCPFWEI